jgi:hypothetical protein
MRGDSCNSSILSEFVFQKKPLPKKAKKDIPRTHIIHKAIRWQKMLDEVGVASLSELAKNELLTRAMVTQIMNLLRLLTEIQEFLARLDDPKEIRRYSERRLRNSLKSRIDVKELND